MYYDLHIHSALSPCSDDTMTIHNIFNMAYIKGLQLIAITDHNSLKQQAYLDQIVQNKILKGHIDFLHGVELQSLEEIHVLAYFQRGTPLKPIQQWIDQHLIQVPHQPDYYGNQYIFNEMDEIIDQEDRLLLSSLDLNIYKVVEAIHQFQGVAVLAHVLAKRYGIYEIYHDIPADLQYDALEVTCLKEYRDLKKICPHIDDEFIFINSDAHQLEDIQEPFYEIDEEQLQRLWRKALCRKSQ